MPVSIKVTPRTKQTRDPLNICSLIAKNVTVAQSTFVGNIELKLFY